MHSECNSNLNGVSLEFTGELADDGFSVTECLGGSMGLKEDQLPLRYQVGPIHNVHMLPILMRLKLELVILRSKAQLRAVTW